MKNINRVKNIQYVGKMFLLIICMISFSACGKKKQEEYRQIQVYEIEGTVTVERQGSSMEAYHNMQLQSGDFVETTTNSYVQLKLDEDKYILLEPETKISLQATGNSADSNTAIFLEKGAIVNCWEDCKLVQSLWKTVWRLLKNMEARDTCGETNIIKFG